jgi:hypothetical protein
VTNEVECSTEEELNADCENAVKHAVSPFLPTSEQCALVVIIRAHYTRTTREQ